MTTITVALALLVTLVGPPLAAVPATAAPASLPLQVDFATSGTTPAPGFVLDFGQAYGARSGPNQGSGLSYGWVSDGTATPLNNAGAGRNRGTVGVDAKQSSFVLMQPSVATAGAWEAEVADGWYSVTVGVGDSGAYYDSVHAVSVEGVPVVEPFAPSPYSRLRTGTGTVQVADGRLTVRPAGGTNVKITFLTVAAAPPPTADPVLPLKVDFGAQTSTPVPGNVLDDGTAFGFRAQGRFGWVAAGTSTPLNLAANGRQRSATGLADPRQATFVHMQGGSTPTPGDWQLAVPPGTYRVTVGTGDASNVYDSRHAITVEGAVAIAPYTPTFATKFKVGVVDVGVTDGLLTVSAAGGSNTKIDFLEIQAWSTPVDPPFPIDVDFGTSASVPAAGYQLDAGAPFGPKQGSYTYGWVDAGTGTPLDVSAGARQRTSTLTTDPRQLSLIQMQSGSVPVPMAWELAVPVGTYQVTVGVGDAAALDSSHTVEVENSVAVNGFRPTSTNRFAAGTVTVNVIDGRLTVTPLGGINTKITYLEVDFVDSNRPRVSQVTPGGGESGAVRDLSVTTELFLPVGAINPTTVTAQTVRLVKFADGSVVPSSANTSGGGDVLVLTPTATLEANTKYQFVVTDGVKDIAGNAFLPFKSTFTTGTLVSGTGIPGVAFTQEATAATGKLFTSVTFGPDGRLYAATLTGTIYRYDVAPDGSLGNEFAITTVRTLNGNANRTVIGLTFDPASTAGNPILWVSDNFVYAGNADVPDWSSKIDRLTGPDLQTGQTVLVNLPRSAHDHEANSIAFGPDGKLYFSMGSNTGMGYPDVAWANRPEVQLSGAILRLDPAALPGTLPLDVKTVDGGGSYDPKAAGAPLTIYATGVRNAFDLVWTSAGRLYAPTNGSAAGANLPAVADPLPAACGSRIDAATNGAYTYSGPTFATIFGNPVAQTDFIHKVAAGGYYGHPNPARCEFIAYGGNPTTGADDWQESQYPVGVTPDRNFRAADVFDGGLHASANGTVEYRSSAFGGKLTGKLLVVRYSAGKDVEVVDVGGPDGAVRGITTGVSGFGGFAEPLDIAENPSGSGVLYVTELGAQRITLLRPAA